MLVLHSAPIPPTAAGDALRGPHGAKTLLTMLHPVEVQATGTFEPAIYNNLQQVVAERVLTTHAQS